MQERLFGGYNIEPDDELLDSSYFYFAFCFKLHRFGMIVLAALIFLGWEYHARNIKLLATCLTVFDMFFFTNPLLQTTEIERANSMKLVFK